MAEQPKPGSIVHVEIPTKDIAKAKKFHSEIFGWKFQDVPEQNYTMFEAPGGAAGGLRAPMEENDPGVLNYILVNSVDARKIASQAASVSVDVKVGASAYNNGATQTTTTSYVRKSRTDATNPISAAEWTATNINDLIVAARCVDCTPNNRATKVQASVDASPGGSSTIEAEQALVPTSIPTYAILVTSATAHR